VTTLYDNLREVMERLRVEPSVEVVDFAGFWELRVRREGGFLVEVHVPHDVKEWFVHVLAEPGDQKVWQDWADYYVSPGVVDTEEEAASLMVGDVELFIERLLVSPLRVVEVRGFLGRRRERVEWHTGDEDWEPLAMCLGA
jgi:hypothetical protein